MTEELQSVKNDETTVLDSAAQQSEAVGTEVNASSDPQPGPPPLPPTPEELAALRQKAAKADEYYDLSLRTRAELDNFRKRAARERQDAVRFASQGLLEKLIPVLDNFDMAMLAVSNPGQASLETLKQGVAMVQAQLKSIMTDAGVQEVDAAGQAFDPKLHEAVSHAESADVAEGHVLQQLRKGYKLHERLIRPATVVVAKSPAS